MGNQASKAIDKTRERKSERKSKHRAQSFVSTSASSTERSSRTQTDEPDTSSSTHKIITSSSDIVQATTRPNRRPTTSRKKHKSGLVIDQDDFKEIDRSQRQHYVLKGSRKANHSVPFHGKGVILDIGTGHGDWAYEVASTYPKARIIGLDLNPPTVPVTIQKNLTFKEQDITQPWDIHDNSVDFLFQRDMNRVLLKSDWDHILSEMYRVLRPDGVIEIIESDYFHHNAGPVQTEADDYFKNECDRIGRDRLLAEHLADDIRKIGFIKVDQKSLDIPVGEWPSDPGLKQIGFNNLELQRSKLRSLRSAYVDGAGVSGEDYDTASKAILAEYEQFQGFTKWICWTAQKPTLKKNPL